MSIVFSSLGFMLQTLGFKDGHSVIVCTCAAVSSMVTGKSVLLHEPHVPVMMGRSSFGVLVTCASDSLLRSMTMV